MLPETIQAMELAREAGFEIGIPNYPNQENKLSHFYFGNEVGEIGLCIWDKWRYTFTIQYEASKEHGTGASYMDVQTPKPNTFKEVVRRSNYLWVDRGSSKKVVWYDSLTRFTQLNPNIKWED